MNDFSDKRFKQLAGLLAESADTRETLKEGRKTWELEEKIRDAMWKHGAELTSKAMKGKRVRGHKRAVPSVANKWDTSKSPVEGVVVDGDIGQDYDGVVIHILIKTDDGEEVWTDLGDVEILD